jgi:hypothetical protein
VPEPDYFDNDSFTSQFEGVLATFSNLESFRFEFEVQGTLDDPEGFLSG